MVTANIPTGAVTPEEIRFREMPVEQQLRFDQLQQLVNRRPEALKLWDTHFTPSDRERFGESFHESWLRLRTIGMWSEVKGLSYLQASIDVARTLGYSTPAELDHFAYRLGFADPNCEDGLMLTAKRNALVVVLGAAPRIFWLGRELTIDWDNKGAAFDYFLKLCRATKEGVVLTNADFDNNDAGNALANRKMRLLRTAGFPADLADRITVRRGEGHTLNIERARLQILEVRRGPRFVVR